MNAPISVADAQTRILALAQALPIEAIPLAEASGRWLARDLKARRTQPFADLSSMDGYAIRFTDLPGPLHVTGVSAAGSPAPPAIGPGETMRIFTGAPVPLGADAILVQENADRSDDILRLAGEGPAMPGAHIRRKGSDFSEGAVVVRAGTRLTPAHIALAAMAGHDSVPVHRRVRIVLISTGNELRPVGSIGAVHQIPSSNAIMLATMLQTPAAEVRDLGIAPDNRSAIIALIDQARDADIIITSGGASVGDHDLVKPAFEAAGARLDFWKVAVRPGRPLMAGTLGNTILLGLPGNPVSAYATALLFAQPLIAALAGAAQPIQPHRRATLGQPLPANAGRAHYMRGRWENGAAVPLPDQDSALLSALASAALLIVRAPNAPAAAVGDTVEILDIA